jgi:hypothetical protein
MEITLRPLTLGEILDRTASIYRKNFWLLAGISAIYAGIVLALGLCTLVVMYFIRRWYGADAYLASLQPLALLLTAVMLILSAAPMAAVNRVIAWLNLGEKATIRGAYASVLKRWKTYITLMSMLVGMIYGPYLIFFGGFYAFLSARGFGAGAHQAQMNQSSMLVIGLISLVFILFVPMLVAYMIWMALRCALSLPACVVEGLTPRASIRRSIELTTGARGRIFVLFLLVMVIQYGLILLFDGPFLISIFKQAMAHPGEIHLVQEFVQRILMFFITTFVTPIYSTGFMLFYYDQRVRKEGFDIEWMMQAAGLNTPVEAASVAVTIEPEPPALPSADQVEPSAPSNEAHE